MVKPGLRVAITIAMANLLLGPCGTARSETKAIEPDGLRLSASDPEVKLGDRLFFETRFSQYFFAHCHGNINASLEQGDPVVEQVNAVDRAALPGRVQGQSINCRQCHLGDDFVKDQPLAGRTYVDFSRRSPIPDRGDGLTTTSRNSPSMVDFGLPREEPVLLHFDGEFATAEDLTVATLTGRNFGWLPDEVSVAVAHIVQVIRQDSGRNPRQLVDRQGNGVPYRVALMGTDPNLPPNLVIPEQYRVDVMKASDEEVLAAVAKLIHAYMDSLRFGTHNTMRNSESPYDLFLQKNGLPAEPQGGESNLRYSIRLLALLQNNKSLKWVTPSQDGTFKLHDQPYCFGKTELEGLKIFLTRGNGSSAEHAGNCVMCHSPPHFTDHKLHNTGVSQTEYDGIFGSGAFAALEIPDLSEREAHFDNYLPPSSSHPRAKSRFRAPPDVKKPGYADLGAWNVFANPDLPKPQKTLDEIFCGNNPCDPASTLPRTVAFFKTASVRDLGQSNPYFHSGAANTIEDALHFYVTVSGLARAGKLRNGSPELADIHLIGSDVIPLAAFLRSLNEDYH